MNGTIDRVVIIGSGTMGSGIAGHLANAGIRSCLLDIVPTELTESERAAGLTLESREVRNRIARNNRDAEVKKKKMPSIMRSDLAKFISVGNLEDDLEVLKNCDWVIEAVSEKLEVKRSVLNKIAAHIRPGTIVTSNTSGISIDRIAEEMPTEFQRYWMGAHFFNPARYMSLLELIPGRETLPEVVAFMQRFGEQTLGKSTILCKDTPNFIANRVGANRSASVLRLTKEMGLTFSEVDDLTGTVLGRPKTGTYHLYDMVGLDIGLATMRNIRDNILDEVERTYLNYPKELDQMLQERRLGDKTGGGFYLRKGRAYDMLDWKTWTYGPVVPASFPSYLAAQKEKNLAKRLEIFFESDDAGGRFVWAHMKDYLLRSAALIPEISDNILNIDRAMVLGFNYEAGPFGMWNGLDLPKYVKRMEREGSVIPAWLREMLSLGHESFYAAEGDTKLFYDIEAREYRPIPQQKDLITAATLKAEAPPVFQSASVTLWDMGDGVLGVQMHSPNSAINEEVTDGLRRAQEELEKDWVGMVIAGTGKNFCAGANLRSILERSEHGEYSHIEARMKEVSELYLRNKYSPKPVVAAPYGRTLGGGCEMVMHCSGVQAHGELHIGLVEFNVGLTPGYGGIKELTMRALARARQMPAVVQQEILLQVLQTIMHTKVSNNALEAQALDFLREHDGISLSAEWQLSQAKAKVLEMVRTGYRPPMEEELRCPGRNGNGILLQAIRALVDNGTFTEYDEIIARKIAYVITGGGVSTGERITERYLLQLEREIFTDLCREARTQARIRSFLETGKPVHN